MRVFVLCTGRCGSLTFAKACEHIDNYTAGHESNTGVCGPDRVCYPDQHVEVDNRLAWLLGRLHDTYRDNALYVHLCRNEENVAQSFLKRWHYGIMKAYADTILMNRRWPDSMRIDVCRDYVKTVNRNIELFLQDKSQKMRLNIEDARRDFPRFWTTIDAKGNREKAVDQFKTRLNTS